MREAVRPMVFHFAVCLTACVVFGCADPPDDETPPAPVGRDTVIIDGMVPSCPSCTLHAEHIVTLGSPTDPETPRHLPTIVRDSRGFYYAASHGWSGDLVLRYDPGGRFLGTLGARGNGPGEYTMTLGLFVTPGDSVFVSGQRRELILFSPEGAHVRTSSTLNARPIGVVPGGGGALFGVAGVAGVSGVSGRGWDTYAYVLNPDATPRDSFPIFSSRLHVPRTPVVGEDGNLWIYHADQYRIEARSSEGRTLRVIGVRTPAFPLAPVLTAAAADSLLTGETRAVRLAERAPRRELLRRVIERKSLGIAAGRDGLVWVATLAPKPGWERIALEPMRESVEAPGENLLAPDDESALRVTVVEVLDPARGELIARTAVPFGAALFAAGYLARPVTDITGHLRMEVHRVTLRGYDQSPAIRR